MNDQHEKIAIYGIRNCTTMKKTFAWLEERGVSYAFHDYKKHGVPQSHLADWCARLGWQALLNTRGTTWRQLTAEQQTIATVQQAMALMIEYPSVIRRPVLEVAGELQAGFSPQTLEPLVCRVLEQSL
jgi:Spx/MgsR family transcriptional regulator